MKFCEKLKVLRTGKGWTQEKLAKELYVSRSAVAKWEQGRGYPSVETLEKIAEIFEYPLDNLFEEKEYRSVTIETNREVKKQKKYYIIGAIGICFVLSLFLILFAVYFLNKEDEESLYCEEYKVYCTVQVEDEGLRLICQDKLLGTEFFIENQSHIYVEDKYGWNLPRENLRTGQVVLFTFYAYDYHISNETISTVKLDVIDDYVEGDYNIRGFFISSEEIDFPEAPIYNGNLDIIYKYKGEAESLGERFPAIEEYKNGHNNHGLIIKNRQKIKTIYSETTKKIIAEEYGYSIELSNRGSSYYLYALDNSEKGYSLVQEIKAPAFYGTASFPVAFKGGLLEESNNETTDWSIPKRIDAHFKIQISFCSNVDTVEFSEYDKNKTCVNKVVYDDFSKISGIYVTQDETTRYISIKTYRKDGAISFTDTTMRGESIEITLESYYGFFYKRKITIY